MFANKVILITGGTGSFGNAAIERMIYKEFEEIRVFSRDEKKQDDMRTFYNSEKLSFYIGDVRNYDSINNAIDGVDYIFNAAALKQVPSCEFFPLEAVKTNILGLENVINAAIYHDVKKLIILSTDKAVYPINAMGMSKALMEKLMIAKARTLGNSKTILCGTRYGNVMASRGSVIPLFIKQIKQKKPLTITNPNMTRYLLSLDEAIDLVFYAFQNGNPGDIFVQKAPACTISDLATALLELFNADNEIEIIGTRHGEKLFESLLTSEEMARSISEGEYYRIPLDGRGLNYAQYYEEKGPEKENLKAYTSHNSKRLSVEEIKNILIKLDYIKEKLKD